MEGMTLKQLLAAHEAAIRAWYRHRRKMFPVKKLPSPTETPK